MRPCPECGEPVALPDWFARNNDEGDLEEYRCPHKCHTAAQAFIEKALEHRATLTTVLFRELAALETSLGGPA